MSVIIIFFIGFSSNKYFLFLYGYLTYLVLKVEAILLSTVGQQSRTYSYLIYHDLGLLYSLNKTLAG